MEVARVLRFIVPKTERCRDPLRRSSCKQHRDTTLPILAGDTLRFAPWRPGQTLTSNRYGIPEPDVAPEATLAPEQMALVVAPLVGFDALGQRLGMGGGWYDRSFAFRHQRPAPPWLVGVGFSVQQVDDLPVQPWDVAVDAICTEATTLVPVAADGRHLPR